MMVAPQITVKATDVQFCSFDFASQEKEKEKKPDEMA